MLEKGTKVFGEWSIDEKIGSGAFGTVYKIKREEFGEEYYAALKVINIPQDYQDQMRLRSEGMDNESINTYYGQLAQNFIQEIKLLSSLDGITNIVDYKDHSVVKNGDLGYTIYIKMQLLTPLSSKLIDTAGNAVFLSAEEVLSIGADICSALMVCEKHKILHRDIKIDNIFVSANGDYKLGDFGIAKQLESTQSEMSKKGTVMYMAPEVFRGDTYNNTADIYSLGIVLYRLLNKNRAPFFPPFPAPIKFSDKETANAQRLNGVVLPDIPGISDEFMAVLRKACAFKPAMRYQSAADFKKDLQKIVVTESNNDKTVQTYFSEVEELTDTAPLVHFDAAFETEDTQLLEQEPIYDYFSAETELFQPGIESQLNDTQLLETAQPVDYSYNNDFVLPYSGEVRSPETVTVFDCESEETELFEDTSGYKLADTVNKNNFYDKVVEAVASENSEGVINEAKSEDSDEDYSEEINKKRKTDIWILLGMVILIFCIGATIACLIPIIRCPDCGTSYVFLENHICEPENPYLKLSDDDIIEYSDGTYAYSNTEPMYTSNYECEGYYVTSYVDNAGFFLYGDLSFSSYDELISFYGDVLSEFDCSEENICNYSYQVNDDEYLAVNYYQYRWICE